MAAGGSGRWPRGWAKRVGPREDADTVVREFDADADVDADAIAPLPPEEGLGRGFGLVPPADRSETVGRGPPTDAPAERTDADTPDEDASSFFAGERTVAAASRTADRDPPDAYRKALGLLVRREHSRRELRRKLDAKGADPAAAAAALDTLADQGYQDDTRFADMLVRTRIGGGYGPQRIRAELGTHGIDDAAVTALFDAAAPDWPRLAIDALRRRYGARPANDNAERLKRSHYLMRRGFDGDSIRAALKHEFDG